MVRTWKWNLLLLLAALIIGGLILGGVLTTGDWTLIPMGGGLGLLILGSGFLVPYALRDDLRHAIKRDKFTRALFT